MIQYRQHNIQPTYNFSNGKADYTVWPTVDEDNQENGWVEPYASLEDVYRSIDEIHSELRSFTESKQTLI